MSREINTVSSARGDRTYAFGVTTTTHLKVLLAQEIFSNFLLALTERIGKVAGQTFEIGKVHGQRLRNNFLRTLSHAVLDSGLATDLVEADSLVIPPFYARGLLPHFQQDGV